MDQTRLAAMAVRLIEANGRACTFSRKGQAAADATKPWRSPTSTPGAGGPVSYSGVKAVITKEEYGDKPGSLIQRPLKMVVLVAAGSFPDGHIDLKTLDRVDDGSTVWKISDMDPIMPGSVPLVYQGTVEG